MTITPRGRSLGVTQFWPLDERRNYRRDYLLARLAVGLGGRAAEELACAELTSGAQNDLQQVTQLARAMVTQLGMAEELGPLYLGGSASGLASGAQALGEPPAAAPWEPRDYSDETARRIDAAIQRLLAEAHQRARALLAENRATLDAIAAALLREEALDREDLAALVSSLGAPVWERRPVTSAPAVEAGAIPGLSSRVHKIQSHPVARAT